MSKFTDMVDQGDLDDHVRGRAQRAERAKRAKSEHQHRVELFMVNANQSISTVPTIPSDEVCLFRAKLILEEVLETILALGVDISVRYTGVGADGEIPVTKKSIRFYTNPTRGVDIVEVADGCADISVVTVGTLSAFGIADVPLLEMVDESNLAKFRGDAHRDEESGKWIKPSDWKPPAIKQMLVMQGYIPPEHQRVEVGGDYNDT